ncbi:hypothetical protein BGZ93_004684 [Podila epicladia]|nr:hypothetical protein BGZ93_004684 [Podila epicladia]
MTDTHPRKAGEREPLLHHNNNNSSGLDPEASTQQNARIDNYISNGLSDQASTPTDNEVIRLAALQALPWYRRPSLYWLLPLVFLAAIVLGVSSFAQEQLTIGIICKNHFRNIDVPFDDDICASPAVQAAGALALSRIKGIKYTAAIFTVGYLTSQSDRLGRKFLIYLTLIPAMATQLLILYMAHPSTTLGTWWLYAEALVVGALGGSLLLDPGLMSYVADCTPREGRSLAIGFVMVALSVGLIVGPTLGSTLIEMTGDTSTALEVSLVTLTLLCLYTVILPESMPKRAAEEKSSSAKIEEDVSFWVKFKTFIQSVLDPLLLFLPGGIDASSDVNATPSKYTLLLLVAAYGCLQSAGNGLTTVFVPYTNLVFGWKTEIGQYFTFAGASSFVVYVMIFPMLQAIYKRVFNTSSTSEAQSVHEDEVLREKRKQGAVTDLAFFVFGSFVYTVGYLIVPRFEVEPALFVCLITLALENVCSAWEARTNTDAAKLNPDIIAFIKTVPILSAPSFGSSKQMLKGMLKSNSVLAVTSNTDLIRKIGVFNVVSKKVVDCTVGVDMSEGISIIGQSLIDKATKANKNLA